ncbi:hypothetical protein ACET3Z_027500 [Daucus carota]
MDVISKSMNNLSFTSSSELRSSFSSEERVLDDEDLLALIFLRVPWKKLMTLKCVSKQWLCFITSSRFRKLLPPLRASGLYIHRLFKLGRPDRLYLIGLDNPQTNRRIFTSPHHSFVPPKFRILHSCNGLLLCAHNTNFRYNYYRNCCVWNPSTKQLDNISQHPPGTRVSHIGLAFNPLKSLHYKVIAFVSEHGFKNVGFIYIYSSVTSTWRFSVQSFNPAPHLNFTDGVYWNGRVHWLSELQDVNSVPKSDASECLCFNVDEERFETFPRPPIAVKATPRKCLYFGESEGHLHVIEVFPSTTSLKVYEMKSDYSGWFVKYKIPLAPISEVFPETTQHKTCLPGKNNFAVTVHSLIRRESFQEDPLLVLEIPGKLIWYNIVDRSTKVILDFGADFDRKRIDYWEFGMLKVSQHIASL